MSPEFASQHLQVFSIFSRRVPFVYWSYFCLLVILKAIFVLCCCPASLLAQFTPSQERGLAQAMPLYKAAMELAAQQKYDEAATEMAKVLEITRDTFGKEHGAFAGKCLDLASLLDHAGQFKQALPYYEESLRLNLKFFGPNHEAIAETRRIYGTCLTNTGNLREARSELIRSAEVAETVYGKDSNEYPRFLNDLGYCFVRSGDWDRGEGYYRECLALRLKQADCTSLALATTHNNLGDVLTKRCDYANARSQFDRAIEILRNDDVVTSKLSIANATNNIGFLYRKQGDLKSAVVRRQLVLLFSDN